jgi:hypothetical protein
MTNSWFIEKEFHPVFKRINEHTDLKGCRTPDDIRKRMDSTIKGYDLALKTGYIKDDKTRRKFLVAKKKLKQLRDSDFPEATIAHANRHPDGIVNQTLLHGYEKAKALILARKRRLMKTIRVRKRKKKKEVR